MLTNPFLARCLLLAGGLLPGGATLAQTPTLTGLPAGLYTIRCGATTRRLVVE